MNKRYENQSELDTTKTCLFCRMIFKAKRAPAKYCCVSHRVQYNQWIKTTNYDIDPNEGVLLKPGTIVDLQIPESNLIFQGSKPDLVKKLTEMLPDRELLKEIEYIDNLRPFVNVKKYDTSFCQIFLEEEFMEVIRTSMNEYKLYLSPW